MKGRLLLLMIVLVGGIGWMVRYHYFMPREPALVVYGTLEAHNIDIGSKVGGRVVKVLAREGDRVRSGQTLVVFDDEELKARVLQAQGRVQEAQANVEKMQRGSRPEEIAEAQAATAENSADGRGFRNEEVAQARADLERARAELISAEKQHSRATELAATGAASRQFLDDAEARLTAARAMVRGAEHAVAAAEGRLRAAMAVTEKTEHGFRAEDLAAARAELTQAKGELKEAEALRAEHELRAPADAVVEVLDLQQGDLVVPNAIVARLLKTDDLYAMVYVPETRVSEVTLGLNAEVRVDAFPGKTFTATVEQIRQQAEFLPRNVQTREERVHQVIGVKLRLAPDAATMLRAGVSIEARFPRASA